MGQNYSYRPLSPRSTRVLVLKPDADRSAPLHCSLEEISLDAIPVRRYNGLSYVWGAKGGTIPLVCEGKTILITPNCESALRHLRHSKKPVTLWVDAICINQVDLDERAQQVSLMGDVYRNADEVIIWLGESTKHISRVFSRMRILSRIFWSGNFYKVLRILRPALRRKFRSVSSTSRWLLSFPPQILINIRYL